MDGMCIIGGGAYYRTINELHAKSVGDLIEQLYDHGEKMVTVGAGAVRIEFSVAATGLDRVASEAQKLPALLDAIVEAVDNGNAYAIDGKIQMTRDYAEVGVDVKIQGELCYVKPILEDE